MDDKCFDALEVFLNSKESPSIIFKSSNVFVGSRNARASKATISKRVKLSHRIGRKLSKDEVWAFRGYNITLYGGKTKPHKYMAVLSFDQLSEIYSKDFLEGNFRGEEMQSKICMLLKLKEFDPFKGVTPSCGSHSPEHLMQLIRAKADGICPLGCGAFYEDKDELEAHVEFVKELGVDDTLRVKPKELLDGVDF